MPSTDISKIRLPNGVTYNIKSQAPTVLQDTTANWNAQSTLVSQKDCVYVYTDHHTVDGQDIPGIKIGDGNAYLIDLPFTDAAFIAHIADDSLHVSDADRESWENKVSCFVEPDSTKLTFSTD